MKKNIFILLILLVGLTSCANQGATHNNIINTVVKYEEINVADFSSMTEVAVGKASTSNIAVISTKTSILNRTQKLGSGVIIKRIEEDNLYAYYVLTNRHVIEENGTILNDFQIIYDGNEKSAIEAELITYHRIVDIALLKFKTTLLFEPATIGDSQNITKGSFIIAYGTPYSLDFFGTANFGIISAPRRQIEDEVFNSSKKQTNYYIQHDASINSGNSGGGLFDIYGNLIGINTLKLVGSSNDKIEGISFAIPIHQIQNLNEFSSYFK